MSDIGITINNVP